MISNEVIMRDLLDQKGRSSTTAIQHVGYYIDIIQFMSWV